MNFIYYEKEGNKVALNLELVKELYVKEIDENTLELWADDKKIHTLSEQDVREYIENMEKTDSEILEKFYIRKKYNEFFPPKNKIKLDKLKAEEYLELFKKVEEKNLYNVFREFYPLAIVRMMNIDGMIITLRKNRVEVSVGWFCLQNLIAILYTISQNKS